MGDWGPEEENDRLSPSVRPGLLLGMGAAAGARAPGLSGGRGGDPTPTHTSLETAEASTPQLHQTHP